MSAEENVISSSIHHPRYQQSAAAADDVSVAAINLGQNKSMWLRAATLNCDTAVTLRHWQAAAALAHCAADY